MITVLVAVLCLAVGFVAGSFYEYLREDAAAFGGARSTTPDDVPAPSPFTVDDRKRLDRTLAGLEAHRAVADRWLA